MNYWQEECCPEIAKLKNKLCQNQNVFFVYSTDYPRVKLLSMLTKNKSLNLLELEAYAYKNQRWDKLRTSQKIENLLSNQVRKINRSEFFSSISGDTVNLLNSRNQAIIWYDAYLTSRAFLDYGKFLLSKIEIHISHDFQLHGVKTANSINPIDIEKQ